MINKVILVGRLSREPRVDNVNGYVVCKFNLVLKRLHSKDENAIDVISCVAWGKQADNMSRYLFKGSLISVIGHLQVDVVKDNYGKEIFFTKVQVEQVQFLESKGFVEYKNQKAIAEHLKNQSQQKQ